MKRLQAYRYQLIPSSEQHRQMRCYAGACRFVFNKALAWQNEQYQKDNSIKFSYTKLANMLPSWKEELPWLKESPSQTLQQALKDLERAYTNFFAGRADFPRFKKRGRRDSFRFPQGFKLDQDNSRIFLPKLGWVRYRNSREVLGTIKNVTITLRAGKAFVSIQTEREVEVPAASGGEIGIDVGIACFAALSNGEVKEPLNSFRRHENRLRKAQQGMSRKTKFSNNWKKAKAKVARIHAQIASARNDFLHKLSTTISKSHAIVCVEDLQVGNMSRSAAGNREAPGTNVRAKSGLNKSILDQGWFEFRRQLDYKLAWNGGWLVAVPPQNTSRTCPACSHVSADNRQTRAEFRCVECGFEENADVVGAINILREGLSRLACQANEVARRQQEPTEALLVQ
jgi:putative transposase